MAINITTTQAADPFTAGYKAVVAILRANATLMGKVSRINDWSDGRLEAPLQALNSADLPELSLVQGGHVLRPFGSNSKVVEAEQTYTIVAITDTLQIARANLIKWAIEGAFHWNNPEFATWGGDSFCRGYAWNNGSDGTNGVLIPGLTGSPARGVDRLVSIISFSLLLYSAASNLPA